MSSFTTSTYTLLRILSLTHELLLNGLNWSKINFLLRWHVIWLWSFWWFDKGCLKFFCMYHLMLAYNLQMCACMICNLCTDWDTPTNQDSDSTALNNLWNYRLQKGPLLIVPVYSLMMLLLNATETLFKVSWRYIYHLYYWCYYLKSYLL